MTAMERLWRRVEPEPNSNCWIWTGATVGNGYGHIWIGEPNRRTVYVHRLVYETTRGPVDEGKDLDHLCRVRSCVNPAHLEPVTRRENLLRGETIVAENAQKTACRRGHQFTPENTRMQGRGRACWTCINDARRRRYRERVRATA